MHQAQKGIASSNGLSGGLHDGISNCPAFALDIPNIMDSIIGNP
jgi:hypothetical protein